MTDEEREKQEEFLNEHLPYRMAHLDGLIWAGSGPECREEKGLLTFQNGIRINWLGLRLAKNSILEIGLINCRIIAQFLGIGLAGYKNAKEQKDLESVSFEWKRVGYPEDYFVSKIRRLDNSNLASVSEDDIAELENSGFSGLADSLKFAIWAASKASAHLTISESVLTEDNLPMVITSAKALLLLVEKKVYGALSLPLPHYKWWTEPEPPK